MIRVKCMTYSTYRILLTENDLVMIEDLQKALPLTFSGVMHDVIKRGLSQMTDGLSEKRS